jgi:hypothetical protein
VGANEASAQNHEMRYRTIIIKCNRENVRIRYFKIWSVEVCSVVYHTVCSTNFSVHAKPLFRFRSQKKSKIKKRPCIGKSSADFVVRQLGTTKFSTIINST